MSIYRSIPKILGIAIIAASFATNTPVRAADWIALGGNEAFEYQVDLDGESTKGDIWTAPLKATTAGVDLGYGKLSINCSDRTLQLQLHQASSGWNEWGIKDLKFAHGICTRNFPDYGNFAQSPNQKPILNRDRYNSIVVSQKCSYVAVEGQSLKSCD